MSERDFVQRLGDELTAAARRQAERRRGGWRGRAVRALPRRGRGRALVLVGALALVGAGGTAGLLAARGQVGGPPSLTFARISPQQRAAGVRPLTRPVVFARGRLAYDRRPWQLVGFQTTRGLCIEIDFPREDRAGGCGSPAPRGGRPVDWQAQIAIARLARGLVLGAVDPHAATVAVRHGLVRISYGRPVRLPLPIPPARDVHLTRARVVHVRDPRLLAAMGLRAPFAYWIAELASGYNGMRADARDTRGRLLGRAGIPYDMNDTSMGIRFQSHVCNGHGPGVHARPRLVSALPPRAVRDQIAALRRAQRPGDLPPRLLMDLVTREPFSATVEVDAIRLLRTTPGGQRIYLVPSTMRALDVRPSPGCLRTLAPHQREREAQMERRARQLARIVRLEAFLVGPRSVSGATGFYPELYRHGHPGYGTQGNRVVGMAPDGIASVELRFAGGVRRSVPVVGNVWLVTAPGRAWPRTVLWLDARGRVLRRLR